MRRWTKGKHFAMLGFCKPIVICLFMWKYAHAHPTIAQHQTVKTNIKQKKVKQWLKRRNFVYRSLLFLSLLLLVVVVYAVAGYFYSVSCIFITELRLINRCISLAYSEYRRASGRASAQACVRRTKKSLYLFSLGPFYDTDVCTKSHVHKYTLSRCVWLCVCV